MKLMNLVGNCDNGAGPSNCKLEGKSCLFVHFEGIWSERWYLQCAGLVFVIVLVHSLSCMPNLGNVLSAWLWWWRMSDTSIVFICTNNVCFILLICIMCI
jgi:hypothetical protein